MHRYLASIPPFDEVPGHIPGSSPVYDRVDVVPWHTGGLRPVDEILNLINLRIDNENEVNI